MMHGSTNIKLINELGNQDSLVNIRSRLQARRSGVWTQAGKREFSVLQQRLHLALELQLPLVQRRLTYLLTPWSRVLLEKLTSKLCS